MTRTGAFAVGIVAVWVVFWIYWLARAATAKRVRPETRYHHLVARAGLIVLIVVLRFALPRGTLIVHGLALGLIGTVLFGAGLATAIWARGHLGRNWGMPMTEKQDAELITTGPYRYVRNPIYSGLLLAVLGTAIALDVFILIAVFAIGAYFVYSARVEEGIMERLFPDTYPAYRARTKMLIPYVL